MIRVFPLEFFFGGLELLEEELHWKWSTYHFGLTLGINLSILLID